MVYSPSKQLLRGLFVPGSSHHHELFALLTFLGKFTVNNKRPVNLDLFTIKQPLPAIASILHRISGILLFIGIGVLIYGLDQSLESKASFDALAQSMDGFVTKFVLWVILSALGYHFIAGIKHLLMDLGVGETLEGGRLGAKLTLGLSVVLIISLGAVLW